MCRHEGGPIDLVPGQHTERPGVRGARGHQGVVEVEDDRLDLRSDPSLVADDDSMGTAPVPVIIL
jgi:hypothetical protein